MNPIEYLPGWLETMHAVTNTASDNAIIAAAAGAFAKIFRTSNILSIILHRNSTDAIIVSSSGFTQSQHASAANALVSLTEILNTTAPLQLPFNDERLDPLAAMSVSLMIPIPINREMTAVILLATEGKGIDLTLVQLMAEYTGALLKNKRQAYQLLQDQAEKFRIRGLLEQFVAPEVVEKMIEGKMLVQLKGERRKITTVTADIRGFTAVSEHAAPEIVVRLLNQFYSKMSDIVYDHSGMVDKFIGDAVLAVFGVSSPREDDSLRAVRSAEVMLSEFSQILEDDAEFQKHFSKLGVGIGITSGDVILGSFGSGKRLDYTVIGRSVNLSARLSSLARAQEILVDEATFRQTHTNFAYKKLTPMVIKGIDDFVQVYSIMA